MVVIGFALVLAAFRMNSAAGSPSTAPLDVRPAASQAAPVLSQVGFVEVDGRILPFRALVRQSESLDDQQLAVFHRALSTEHPSKYCA